MKKSILWYQKNRFCDIKKIDFVIQQNKGYIVKRHLTQSVMIFVP